MLRSSFSVVRHVLQARHVVQRTGSAVSSAAHSSGSAAFLAPEIGDLAVEAAAAADAGVCPWAEAGSGVAAVTSDPAWRRARQPRARCGGFSGGGVADRGAAWRPIRPGSASSSTARGSARAFYRPAPGRPAGGARRGSRLRTRPTRWWRRSGGRRPRPRGARRRGRAAMKRWTSRGGVGHGPIIAPPRSRACRCSVRGACSRSCSRCRRSRADDRAG